MHAAGDLSSPHDHGLHTPIPLIASRRVPARILHRPRPPHSPAVLRNAAVPHPTRGRGLNMRLHPPHIRHVQRPPHRSRPHARRSHLPTPAARARHLLQHHAALPRRHSRPPALADVVVNALAVPAVRTRHEHKRPQSAGNSRRGFSPAVAVHRGPIRAGAVRRRRARHAASDSHGHGRRGRGAAAC